jgi:ABC-type dipeptide/oligopeptide/nickel transport system ATPase component
MSLNQANIIAVMGGSGSGKSTYIKREIKRLKPKRLMVFDIMNEYSDFGSPMDTCQALVNHCQKPSFKVIFKPSSEHIKSQFDFFCKLAFTLGDLVMVVEELNRVTTATKAPPAWQDCTSRGRHKGLSIYGASQRPAALDKDFFSNATKIRTGRLNFAGDIKTLSNVLKVQNSDVDTLKPLEYIERDMTTGVIRFGKLKF